MGLIFVFAPVVLLFLGSQLYWLLRAWAFLKARVRDPGRRVAAAAAVFGFYLLSFAFNFGWLGRGPAPTRLTAAEALLAAPFQCWVASSMVAFLIAILIWLARRITRLTAWGFRKLRPAPGVALSPSRRVFLERTATAAVAAPFVAGAYGLFYGRLNLEISRKHIRLARLPKAFDGFRIVQLSDLHIGPFMSEDQIRRYAGIANALRPDLIVLTGDFVTWDASTQQAVVDALRGLKAPHGVFGCLGNHDAWARVEDSITQLFSLTGIRILRQASVRIPVGQDSFNLIGVDFESNGRMRPASQGPGPLLRSIESLVTTDTANILLSHNPDTFDRAAELGIDLSLAGHTHGGQVSLEFISPEIAPCRIVTPYVTGWFQKPGAQLYVNRGIGTIGVPIRVGAPPEITLFEFARDV